MRKRTVTIDMDALDDILNSVVKCKSCMFFRECTSSEPKDDESCADFIIGKCEATE